VTNTIWQDEKFKLCRQLFNRLFGSEDTITFTALMDHKLPDLFIATVKRHADGLLQKRTPVRLKDDSCYDISSADITAKLDALSQAVLYNTLFSRKELRSLIERAIHLEFDIIVRPRAKMLEFFIKMPGQIDSKDVNIVAAGFDDQRPFFKAVLQKTDGPYGSDLTFKQLESMLTAIENQIYAKTPVSAMITDVKYYLEFEGKVNGIEQNTLRSELLLVMLKERNLNHIGNALRAEAEEKKSWSLAEIENSFNRYLLIGGPETSPAPAPKKVFRRKKPYHQKSRAYAAYVPPAPFTSKLPLPEKAEGTWSMPPQSPKRAPAKEKSYNH
jgi:hypothetical protein